MSLFFKPKPFKDKNGNLIELQDLEIIDFGALNDEVSVEFTLNGTIFDPDHVIIEGTELDDLQQDIERLWNHDNKFILTKRKLKERRKSKGR